MKSIIPVVIIASLIYTTSCTSLIHASVPEITKTDPVKNEMKLTTAAINIISSEELQTIEGFGASGAWWAQDVGGWEPEKLDEIIRLLFDTDTGIGLSIYRYNIGGGDGINIQDAWRRTETFEIAEGLYDWSKDTNAVKVLQAVHEAGVEDFVAFVNSPPARMTISGSTTGNKDGNSNLSPAMYTQFAQYLIDVVRHLQNDLGIPIHWISPVNEPQWNWSNNNGQEGCHYTPAEVVGVTKALIHAIQQNNLDIKVSVFESGEWKNSEDYITALLNDVELRSYLGPISIHSYWSTPEDKAKLQQFVESHYPGTSIWMSEWIEMKDGRDTGMDSALVLANTLHDDLTIGNVSSWQYWIAVSKYNYRDGLIYVNTLDHKITQTKRLWALGNYSRFIRPGFVRVGATSSDNKLRVTAFRAPDSSKWVLVVINNSSQPITAQLSFGPGLLIHHTAIYETSESNDLELVNLVAERDTYQFSPSSVTTLVID
jgi:O-glycosyl hydrolase